MPGPVRGALRARRDPARAAAAAAPARRARRPSRTSACPGIEANSGSLGMGISKGRGIAWAKRHLGRGGRVVVMIGDGELQEGQNYEGLQAAAHERLAGLTVVVDRNELQSDKPTDEIVSLGDLEERFRAFGWHVATCDGHDVDELRARVRVVRATSTTARRRSSRGRSRARASRSWSTRRRCARAAGRTAGTRALPTTRRSSARSRSSSGASTSGSRPLGLEPLSLEPVDADDASAARRSRASPSRARARAARR